MAVDTNAIGTTLTPRTATMDAGRLRFFATTIGETDPVYTDVDAARRAGHADLPVPPTFLFGIELEAADPFDWLAALGVDMRRVLHGEQAFTYHRSAFAGETLTATPRIVDIFSKKNGALEFIVKHTDVTDADGTTIAELTSTIVVQNPGAN